MTVFENELSDGAVCALRLTELSRWQSSLIDDTLSTVYKDVPVTIDNSGGSLTYGELTWSSLKAIMAAIETILSDSTSATQPRCTRPRTFVDFGSGFGRVILGVVCMDHGTFFDELIGVEIDASMHTQASLCLTKLREDTIGRALLGQVKVQFICADALNDHQAWKLHLCDVLYICCTCFDAGLLEAIASLVEQYLKPGALVVSTTRRLNTSSLRSISSFSAECTWGHASIYIDQKRGGEGIM